MKKIIFSLFILVAFVPLLFSQDIELIDIPTAYTLDYGTYKFSFENYQQGNILNKFIFGVTEEMNLGVSLDIENLIGSKPIILRFPCLYLKFKIYGGSEKFPAVAIGYDQQGRGEYLEEIEEYKQREKGIFVVFSKESFTQGLQINLGANVYQLKDFSFNQDVYGFLGVDYSPIDKISLYLEYDNFRLNKTGRVNFGIAYALLPNVNIKLYFKDVTERENEWGRTLCFQWTGMF